MVVSSDSMKKATATSQGSSCFTDSPGAAGAAEFVLELVGIILVTISIAGCCSLANDAVRLEVYS
jgi:hypothetical protein